MKLVGKVALITGGGSGLGRAGALLFAAEGARVAVVDINDTNGNDTVAAIRSDGGEAIYIHADVGAVEEDARMVRDTVETFGALHIFWHNAGIVGPGVIEKTTERDFDRLMAVHLKGGFFGAQRAIPEIRRAGGGSILFTSSIGAIQAEVTAPSYGCAKAALVSLTRSLAVYLAKDNIRVNCILPGTMQTPMIEEYLRKAPQLIAPEELEQVIRNKCPMGRAGDPVEVARVALFLVSDDASYVNGVRLVVDGGQTAR